MQVTDVRIRRVSGESKVKAYVSVTFDDMFVVHDLKVIEGKKGFFVAMPSRKNKSGDFWDTAHPIKTEAREMIQKAVLDRYSEETGSEVFGTSEFTDDDEQIVREISYSG